MRHLVEGFILSILFTLGAYFLVANQLLTGWILIFGVIGLALIQAWIQLVLFLHLGAESSSRMKLVTFLSTLSVMLILVIGSIWIMNNLNYRHMNPAEINKYILQNEAIQK